MSRAIFHAAGGSLLLALSLMATLPASAGALRVVRDPQTGELRGPTAAEVAAFEKAEAQIRAGAGAGKRKAASLAQQPSEIQHPDGTVEMQLGEDSMMFSVVSLAPDGSLRQNCLPAKEAQAYVKGKKTVSSSTKATAEAGHAHK